MGVRQLEEFLGQSDQKGFWIFTYANLGGGFVGAFLGNALLERTAPSLKLLGILLGVVLGMMATWKVKGYPIYKWALYQLLFLLRRHTHIGLASPVIDATLYYRSRAPEQQPYMLITTRNGRTVPVLVHRGSGNGTFADGLSVPLLYEKRDTYSAANSVAVAKRSSHDAVQDTLAPDGHEGPTEPDHGEWGL